MQKGSTEGEIHRVGCGTLRAWVRDKCHTGEGRQVPFGQHKKKIQEELERQQNRNSEEGLQGDEEGTEARELAPGPVCFPIHMWRRTE